MWRHCGFEIDTTNQFVYVRKILLFSRTKRSILRPFWHFYLLPANRASAGTTSTPTAADKPAAKVDEEDEDESSDSSSSSEETESEEESDEKVKAKGVEKTDIGPLLARSAQARDTGSGSSTRRSSRDEGYSSR